jgi:hypothetical protein
MIDSLCLPLPNSLRRGQVIKLNRYGDSQPTIPYNHHGKAREMFGRCASQHEGNGPIRATPDAVAIDNPSVERPLRPAPNSISVNQP